MNDVDVIKENAARARAKAQNVQNPSVRLVALEAVDQAERGDLATLEVKRLCAQLASVQTLAAQWESAAERMDGQADRSAQAGATHLTERLAHRANVNRAHAAAIRDLLSED
jgi:hypothetical protein